MHLDYIWVVYLPQSQDLTLNGLTLHVIIELALLINLDGILLACLSMLALPDDGICTLTNSSTDGVVF